ncbi:hypothetical protein J6590_038027 [Homalodisca vitripennis]|nr:hypothetical protein J6590_038027 [Homalodisca vitripennis]
MNLLVCLSPSAITVGADRQDVNPDNVRPPDSAPLTLGSWNAAARYRNAVNEQCSTLLLHVDHSLPYISLEHDLDFLFHLLSLVELLGLATWKSYHGINLLKHNHDLLLSLRPVTQQLQSNNRITRGSKILLRLETTNQRFVGLIAFVKAGSRRSPPNPFDTATASELAGLKRRQSSERKIPELSAISRHCDVHSMFSVLAAFLEGKLSMNIKLDGVTRRYSQTGHLISRISIAWSAGAGGVAWPTGAVKLGTIPNNSLRHATNSAHFSILGGGRTLVSCYRTLTPSSEIGFFRTPHLEDIFCLE